MCFFHFIKSQTCDSSMVILHTYKPWPFSLKDYNIVVVLSMCFSDGAQIWNSLPFAFSLLLRVPPYGGSCHEYHFCRNRSLVATKDTFHLNKSIPILLVYFSATTNILLSQQTRDCRDKTGLLSQQNRSFVAIKSMLVATKLLSRQIRVCRDKYLSQQFCRDKHHFVATSILLSQQKTSFVMTNTCLTRQKMYTWQLLPMIAASRDDLCCLRW